MWNILQVSINSVQVEASRNKLNTAMKVYNGCNSHFCNSSKLIQDNYFDVPYYEFIEYFTLEGLFLHFKYCEINNKK